jgi:hypothetical protein
MLLEMMLLGICMPVDGAKAKKKEEVNTPEYISEDISDISPPIKGARGISVPTPEHISASPPTPLHSVERGDSSTSSPIETVPTLSTHTPPAVSSQA